MMSHQLHTISAAVFRNIRSGLVIAALAAVLMPVTAAAADMTSAEAPLPAAVAPEKLGQELILKAYDRQLYYDYNWQQNEKPPSYPEMPALLPGETSQLFSQVAYCTDAVAWSVVNADKSNVLVVWDVTNGKTRRIDAGSGSLWGLACDSAGQRLVTGRNNELLFFSLADVNAPVVKAFKRDGAKDLGIAGSRLVVRRMKDSRTVIDLHDLHDLTRISSSAIPEKATQRMIVWSDNEVLLASTYWGSKLKLCRIDAETGACTEFSVPKTVDYHDLIKGGRISKGRLGLFNLEKRTTGHLQRFGSLWVDMNRESQFMANGLGFRSAPVKKVLSALVELAPEKDLPETEHLLPIPSPQHYLHEVKDEDFHNNIVVHDKLGNRYLRLLLPAVKKGEKLQLRPYSARFNRYSVRLDVDRAIKAVPVPDELKIYLEDSPLYNLEHPLIQETLDSLTKGLTTHAEVIQAIYRYAVKIKGVWDSKNESAPNVIVNQHGGCNEHTRVQVALLRRYGIPARFAWNQLGNAKTAKTVAIDHAIAEAWLGELGWVPMEPLGSNRTAAGLSSNYHIMIGPVDSSGISPLRGYSYSRTPLKKFKKQSGLKVTYELSDP